MSAARVHQFAHQLRQYATHFVYNDWAYTRQSGVRYIRRDGDWSGYDHPIRRIGRWLDDYAFWRRDSLRETLGMRWFAWRHPIVHMRSSLRTPRHSADGALDNGAIITVWEETGEYLQYVQPSVGALLADLMDAHPDLPEVVAIADEMKRINDDYGRRIEAAGWDQ